MLPESIELSSTDSPDEAGAAVVDEGLEAHNQSTAPLGDVRPIASFARDSRGRIVGGAIGRTWGACCELLQLWVDPGHRGGGVGSGLLNAFESHARGRRCSVFYLTTLSFQAPEFYRRHGYEVLARIDGYPEGIAKYLMQKKDADRPPSMT